VEQRSVLHRAASLPRARSHGVGLALWLILGAALLPAAAAIAPTPPAAAGSVGALVGRVAVAHQDGARPTDSRVLPLLATPSGPVALRLPGGLPAAPGSRIELHNPIYQDGAIVAADVSMLGPPPATVATPTLGPANFTPGPRNVLVLLVQAPNAPAPGSADAVRSIMFTAPNSVNSYIKEETYGQLSLTGKLRSDGDVFGPYAPSKPFAGVCDPVDWGSEAEAAFKKQTGLDPETWDNVVVVFQEPTSVCGFSGIGEIGQLKAGAARHAWINAVGSGGVPTVSVVAHELGHNLGVDHAGAFNCSADGVRISVSDACATSETSSLADQYLDPFDVMGTGIREESAYHRWESGWLPSSSVLRVVRNGTYLIAPIERSTSDLQLLEVPRQGVPSYWLDFRQPLESPFENFAPSDPVVNGVSIRYANASTQPHPSKSWLIDTTPGTPTFDDAPLASGRSFGDALRGVSMTVVSTSQAGALVSVTVANGADTSPPSSPSGLSSTLAGDGLRLDWNPASDDSGLVQHYRVHRDGALLADLYGTSVIDPAPPIGGSATYDVTAIDPAGNFGGTARLQVAVPDTAPPTAPSGLAAGVSGTSVGLNWGSAADNVGVASYEVDRDGVAIATDLHAVSLTDADVPAGTHRYSVRALDAAGNLGAFAEVDVSVAAAAVAVTALPPGVRLKSVTALTLRRLGKHRVLVSWKAQKGAGRYQVLRSGKPLKLLATIKKVQYLDGHAPAGKLEKSRYVVRAVLN
jgi:hypothetical protein